MGAAGVEPEFTGLEPVVLPLYYTPDTEKNHSSLI